GEGGVGVGGSGGSGVRWRVGESGVDDRETRNLFGFTRKIPPEKFSGGSVVAAAGGRPVVAAAGGESTSEECVCIKME
nr:hypothetical protein [Tanacetum cinerariifolium]GFC79900.1 hypothetical protein [Tanacetum cinerariifolium]